MIEASLLLASQISETHIQQQLDRAVAAQSARKRGQLLRLLAWAQGYSSIRVQLLEAALQFNAIHITSRNQAHRKDDNSIVAVVSKIAADRYSNEASPRLRKALAQRIDSPETQILHALRITNFLSQTAELKCNHVVSALCSFDLEYSSRLSSSKGIFSDLLTHKVSKDSESLNAFRGLHQIPEALAITANKIIDLHCSSPLDARSSAAIGHLPDLITLMIECLKLLYERMTARSYHEIRDYLGQTSGSQSQEISRRLLRSGLSSLSQQLENPKQDKPARLAIQRSLRLLHQWRNLHLLFPLLYLGSGGTRSLIGSADALNAAIQMRDNSNDRNRLTRERDIDSIAILHGIESIVQPTLSAMTQSRFIDVQTRSGFYSKKGN